MPSEFDRIAENRLVHPVAQALAATLAWTLRHWQHILTAFCFSVAGGYTLYIVIVSHAFFWDFNMYAAVVRAMSHNVSPYDVERILQDYGTPFPFLYPPLIVEAFYAGRWLILSTPGRALLLAVHLVSWMAVPYMLAGSPKNWRSQEYGYVWGLYLILFGLGGMKAFASGNIAATLAAIMVLSVVIAVKRRDYRLFWPALFFCSFVKVYFLAFLLFPVILERKYVIATIFVFGFACVYATNYLFDPKMFLDFVAVISRGSLDASFTGRSPYTFAVRALQLVLGPENRYISTIALSMHSLFVVVIVALAYAVNTRRDHPKSFDLYCCWLALSAYFISPRLLDYDIAVMVVPVVLLGKMLVLEGGKGLGVAASATALGFVFMQTPLSGWSAIFALIGVWLGTAVHWLRTPADATTVRGG